MIAMNALSRAVVLRGRLVGKNAIWILFGAAMATVYAVSAQQAPAPTSSTDCALSTAAQNAVNNRLTVIGVTQPDPAKYFTVGGAQSCIGSITNIDLSRLIPDPMGLLTSIAQGLVNTAVRAACTAARQSLSDTLSKYNVAAGMLNNSGQTAVNYINTQIGQTVGTSLTNYGTNYSAPPGVPTQINPLEGITNGLNQAAGGAASAFNAASPTVQAPAVPATSQLTTQPAAQPTAPSNPIQSGLSAVSNLGSRIFSGN